jgi:serpin B
MYLLNAIYFKGSWRAAFDPNQTKAAAFTLRSGQVALIPTMSHSSTVDVGYAGDLAASVIDLPYSRTAFSLTIVLPRSPQGIDTLLETLTSDQWNHWVSTISQQTAENVFLPKFRFSQTFTLNQTLAALGMPSAFCESGGGANFSGIDTTSGGALCISDVRHRGFVDVNEQGTEAAAATSVEAYDMDFDGGPITIRVDHPFIFAIRERFSGTILFLGRVMNPAQN